MTRAERARRDPNDRDRRLEPHERRRGTTCRCGFKQTKRHGFLSWCGICRTGHHR